MALTQTALIQTPHDLRKVVLLEGIHEKAAEAFRAAGFEVESHTRALQGEELVAACADAAVLGIRSTSKVTAAVLERIPRLAAIGCFCIGTNQVDLGRAAEQGVPVLNAPFSNTRSVAELVIGEIIALHRQLTDRSAAAHRGEWQKSAAGSHEIRGRTLGIVGYGRIGSQVSVMAEAMGMRVVFHDVVDVLPLGNARRVAGLPELLAEADVVTLHVPATEATRNLMGAAQMAAMKEGAFLLNNARGDVLDVDALAAALKSRHLAGAAIDVFPKEPESNTEAFETVLRGLPNVILTPHIGGSTLEAQMNIAESVSGRLIKLLRNGSTTTAVNVPEVELPVLHTNHHRFLHFHRNVPGVLGQLNTEVAALGANIAAEFLQTNARHGYAILDVTTDKGAALRERLAAIPETIRVRALW